MGCFEAHNIEVFDSVLYMQLFNIMSIAKGDCLISYLKCFFMLFYNKMTLIFGFKG